MGVRIDRLRRSAKGQKCTLCIPGVCDGGGATTVLAHIRDDQKGAANKANDWSACHACGPCHVHLDEHRLSASDELFYSLRAMQRTMTWWIENGFIKIVGDDEGAKPRAKKLSKVVPHDGRMRR